MPRPRELPLAEVRQWATAHVALHPKTLTHPLAAAASSPSTPGARLTSFDRTVIPVKLARLGTENLLSRSQARRLLARIEQFKVVELDFEGVPEIGQAFADEIFRVFAREFPAITMKVLNAGAGVAPMIRRVRSA